MPSVHDRNKAYVINGKKAGTTSGKARQLASMDARERQKLVRMPELLFLHHRLPGEPLSVDARWK
jgi:hypothetical protein